jgi:DNA-binding phage protein
MEEIIKIAEERGLNTEELKTAISYKKDPQHRTYLMVLAVLSLLRQLPVKGKIKNGQA